MVTSSHKAIQRGSSKLTDAEVWEIRKLYDERKVHVSYIADTYDLGICSIRSIGNRTTWRFVPEAGPGDIEGIENGVKYKETLESARKAINSRNEYIIWSALQRVRVATYEEIYQYAHLHEPYFPNFEGIINGLIRKGLIEMYQEGTSYCLRVIEEKTNG